MRLFTTLMVTAAMTLFPAEIEDFVNSDSMVESSECIVYYDTVIVAVKTKPIFFKTERDELIEKLENNVRKRFDAGEVIISFDKDIYYKVTKISTQIEKGATENALRNEIISVIETARSRLI